MEHYNKKYLFFKLYFLAADIVVPYNSVITHLCIRRYKTLCVASKLGDVGGSVL